MSEQYLLVCTKSQQLRHHQNRKNNAVDPLPAYEKGVTHTFSGKRTKRGLYVGKDGKDGFAINADVNGSLNIGRKVIPEFLGIRDRSLAARPVTINPLKAQR